VGKKVPIICRKSCYFLSVFLPPAVEWSPFYGGKYAEGCFRSVYRCRYRCGGFSLIGIFSKAPSLVDGLALGASFVLLVSAGTLWLVERRGAVVSVRGVIRVFTVFCALAWLVVFALWLYSAVLAPSAEARITDVLEGTGLYR